MFSGDDLLVSDDDVADLDWAESEEQSVIDPRRGLVAAQVAFLKALVDEFILYLDDPHDTESCGATSARKTTGPRGSRCSRCSRADSRPVGLDDQAIDHLNGCGGGTLQPPAHGTIDARPTRIVPIRDLPDADLELEWVLIVRRTGETERISMAGLETISMAHSVRSRRRFLPTPVKRPGDDTWVASRDRLGRRSGACPGHLPLMRVGKLNPHALGARP